MPSYTGTELAVSSAFVVKVRSLPPVFESVRVCTAVAGMGSVAVSDAGATPMSGAMRPVPESGTTSVGVSGSLLAIESDAGKSLGLGGLKLTKTMAVPSGGMLKLV